MEPNYYVPLNLVILLILCFSAAATDDHQSLSLNDVEYKCVYTVYVRTSSTISGGTDSIISVALYDQTGNGVLIKDLQGWGGVMENGHDYYERGNLDIFTGRGPCLDRPVCAMELMSDGSGPHHGWYCNYAEVTTTGPHTKCAQQLFNVEQWLALDRSPYELTAFRDNCASSNNVTAGLRRSFESSKLVPVEILLASDSSY